jgi:HEAT repeat protein
VWLVLHKYLGGVSVLIALAAGPVHGADAKAPATGSGKPVPAAGAAPQAKPPKPKPPKPLTAAEVAALRVKLLGEDLAAATEAARKLGDSAARNAAPPLTELLAVGTVPALAVEVMGALEKIRDPKAMQALTLYAGNRNAPVRKAAVKALAALPEHRVNGVLIERLGDSSQEVRAAAAEALAARKETRAAPRLFKLVAKNDAGAAAPLGALISADDVPRLAELRGRADDSVLATALGEFLKRPNVADRLRVDVIRTLGRMPGAAATTALVEYLTTVPDKDTRPSKDEAQRVVDSRGSL